MYIYIQVGVQQDYVCAYMNKLSCTLYDLVPSEGFNFKDLFSTTQAPTGFPKYTTVTTLTRNEAATTSVMSQHNCTSPIAWMTISVLFVVVSIVLCISNIALGCFCYQRMNHEYKPEHSDEVHVYASDEQSK